MAVFARAKICIKNLCKKVLTFLFFPINSVLSSQSINDSIPIIGDEVKNPTIGEEMKNAIMKIAAMAIIPAGIASATCADAQKSLAGVRVKYLGVNQNSNIPVTFVAAPGVSVTIPSGQFYITSGATSYGGNPNGSRLAQLSLLQQAFQIGANVSVGYCTWQEGGSGLLEITNLGIGN